MNTDKHTQFKEKPTQEQLDSLFAHFPTLGNLTAQQAETIAKTFDCLAFQFSDGSLRVNQKLTKLSYDTESNETVATITFKVIGHEAFYPSFKVAMPGDTDSDSTLAYLDNSFPCTPTGFKQLIQVVINDCESADKK